MAVSAARGSRARTASRTARWAGDGVLAVRGTVHDPVAVREAGLDDHLHTFEKFVVGGGEQSTVEGEVGLDGVSRVRVPLPHRIHRGVHGGEVVVGAPLRGQAHGGRLR